VSTSGDDIIVTPAGRYTLERARAEDADVLMDMFEEAARWLTGRGIVQWEPGSFDRRPLLGSIARGEVYVARLDGQIAATLTLQWEDRETWGDMPPDGAYVHGFVVRRAYGGQGLGRRMLEWAERQAAAAGRTFLRLDCVAGNPALNRYYQDAGFTLKEVVGQEWRSSLYEKRCAPAAG
jgi:GNAT superfamily N-acetyltransferase